MTCASHNSSSRPLLLAALAVALAGLAPGTPATGEAHAGTIQRCAASDGSTLYTDKPCEAFGATPLARPGEATHVVAVTGNDSGTYTSSDYGTSDGYDHAYADAALPRPSARRAPSSGCARTPTQLAMDLQGAFALGDVNRIAESWHWVGLDQAGALPVMQRLERLAMSTLVDARYHDATIGGGYATWASAADAMASAGGIMQLTLGGEGGHQVLDLQVTPYEGCYFVRF